MPAISLLIPFESQIAQGYQIGTKLVMTYVESFDSPLFCSSNDLWEKFY